MEIVKLRYEAMQKALITWQESIELLENFAEQNPKIYRLMRDGTIQRFKYCIDSFWKFLKLYLESVKKIPIVSSAPREILKLTLDNMLITDAEYKILVLSLSDRNLTSHSYSEDLAEEIHAHMFTYYSTMQSVLGRLKIY